VLIGGEAGIGKTVLAEWLLAEAAAQGALPLVGRCYDLAEAPPYGPWLDLVARLRRAAPDAPDLAALPAPFGDAVATSAHHVHRGVVAALLARAARQPLALLLDDLHWADEASLALLRALGQAVAGAPLLVLGTYRPEDLSPGLAALLPRLTREAGAGRLALARLTPADTAALVAAPRPAWGRPPPALRRRCTRARTATRSSCWSCCATWAMARRWATRGPCPTGCPRRSARSWRRACAASPRRRRASWRSPRCSARARTPRARARRWACRRTRWGTASRRPWRRTCCARGRATSGRGSRTR